MQQDAPQIPTRVIALMNQKGGVGKTTTTVNLAAALAAAGRRTLLVDLDPQAHATLHLGIEPGAVQGPDGGEERAQPAPPRGSTIYDVLTDGAPAAPLSARASLDIIPAETDLAAAEGELAALDDPLGALRGALAPVLPRYEFCLIDCPPSLGRLTLSALVAAREVLIPMQAHFLALQGMSKLLETVRMVRGTRVQPGPNPRLRVAGVVLCMHDKQATHTQDVVAELQDFFQAARADEDAPWRYARVYGPAVRRNIKLAECPSFGQTIFDYAPDANGAQDYRELAANMLSEWDAALAKLAGRVPPDPGPELDRREPGDAGEERNQDRPQHPAGRAGEDATLSGSGDGEASADGPLGGAEAAEAARA